MPTNAPERTEAQRMDALQRANQIRALRARLKKDLKGRRKSVDHILTRPPEYVKTMRLFDLVLACPKYGRVKANKVLIQCRISPSRTIGGLSSRQRAEIVAKLRTYPN